MKKAIVLFLFLFGYLSLFYVEIIEDKFENSIVQFEITN